MSLEDERRRSVLLAGATALTGGLAGCTGLLEESDGETTDGESPTATGTAEPTATAEPLDLPVEGEPTRIEYGAEVSGQLTVEDPSDSQFEGHYQPYTFIGSAGDQVSITLNSATGDTYLFLLDEEGNVIAENDDTSTSLNSAISAFELPSDGGYVILAGSFSDDVGFEYQLSLTQVEGDLRSIGVGETRTGVIDSSDPQSSQFNGYYEPVTIDAESGTTVSVSMTSAEGDTFLYVLDPNDNVVGQNDDTGINLNSFVPFVTLSESGEYTIIATSFSPDDTFVYELSVSETGGTTDSISVGETISGELSSDDSQSMGFNGYYDAISLEAGTGTTVDIEMTSQGDTYLYLLSPDGQIVARNDDTSSSLNSAINRFNLSESGEYTIIATSFDPQATFSYELSVSESEPLPDLRSISIGETRTGGIDTSDPREDRFNGYYEPVTFEGDAGQYVDIEMTSESGDTYLYLLDPDGEVVAENDDTSASLNSRIEYELSASGQYTIIATSFTPDATFEYQLSVTEGSAPVDLRSISVGETRTGELDTGDPQSTAFNGYYEPVTLSVDSSTTVDIEMTSQGDTYLYLLDSNDSVIAENDDADGLNSAITGVSLDADDYTIIATSFSSRATFEYQLSVRQA